jgi:two-component system response regulator YesN
MYRTLIVDDADIHLLELERLDAWGEESNFIIANKAKNGVEALARLRESRHDLVITDIRMPKLDGIDLLKEIRKEDLCECVALFSEFGEFEYARSGIVLGAFDYLLKPVEKRNLRALLARARTFLDEREGRTPRRAGDDDPAYAEGEAFFYPKAEEENIIALIAFENADIPFLFREAAESVSRLLRGNELLAGDVVRKFHNNIVRATYEKYPWLDLYVHPRDRRPVPAATGREGAAGAYSRSLSELFLLIGRFVFTGAPLSIREICDYILRNAESDVSLQSIADRFNVNNTYLSNLFKQKTGVGFNEYLTTVKIARAKYYLENTDMKIGDVSYALDYADADYFNRLFKKHTGMTPTLYRKRAGRRNDGSGESDG